MKGMRLPLRGAVKYKMINLPQDSFDILRASVSGFHIYSLDAKAHIIYASRNLLNKLDLDSENELVSSGEDLYADFVHPNDRGRYESFISKLPQSDASRSIRYRLVKKDGEILYVSDTITVSRCEDGSLIGCSVLSDITAESEKNQDLMFLNETIPCGFLKYTCEKQPKILYMNDRMAEMLRFSDDDDDDEKYLEFCKDDIYLMIPPDERKRFSDYLERVCAQSSPVPGEMTLMRRDGTRGRFFGWVTKNVNGLGEEEFHSVCVDVSERYQRKKDMEFKHYIDALTDVYDLIFKYNLACDTVECLYSRKSEVFKRLVNIPMQMTDATEKWISTVVYEPDRESFRRFYQDFRAKKADDGAPRQIKYRSLSSGGLYKAYTGIILNIDESVSLFCSRSAQDEKENIKLKNEIDALKNVQEMVMGFADGIAAFEVVGEFVTPLYASDNVCRFFGYSKDDWLRLMKERTPIRQFVSRCSVTFEEFMNLSNRGEAEFSYFDFNSGTEKRIKTICSRKSPDKSSPRYVMVYKVDDINKDEETPPHKNALVSVRTFGYFDVFVGDKAIAFRSQKSKELFALLVDRKGGFISSDEAIGYLWPEEPSNTVTLARYRKVALRLKSILEEYGISDIVESVDGKRRIVTDRIQCDLYDYLTGKEEYRPLFKGSYLSNYSWGETTLGELTGENIY